MYRDFKRTYPSWEMVRVAPRAPLAQVLKPAGLSNNKAVRIQAILNRLPRDFGRTTLAPLRRMTDYGATGLPGVAEKTAKSVLMYALDCARPRRVHED